MRIKITLIQLPLPHVLKRSSLCISNMEYMAIFAKSLILIPNFLPKIAAPKYYF